ncbi:MAG: ankyrin repeat domain-containing protein [Clostridiales bacterium]|nr:ankyrin repeat domain-containing protein [Clostridiales bacterium]
MENNITYFIRKLPMKTKLTKRAYKKGGVDDILGQFGNLNYSKLTQKLSRLIYQNIILKLRDAKFCLNSAGIKKLYKSSIVNDEIYANALVCIAKIIESSDDLDNTQVYGIVDLLSSLGDVCITGQRRGIVEIVCMLGEHVESITQGKIKIEEDPNPLRRALDKLFLNARIKLANKLMNEVYIKTGRREFTDPHMEDFFKKYLNSKYNFNVPVPQETDPYGINIEKRDIERFIKTIDLEELLLHEMLNDVRDKCKNEGEFYNHILNWATNYFRNSGEECEISDFFAANIFCGQSRIMKFEAIYRMLVDEGYLINIKKMLDKVKSCKKIEDQIKIISKNKSILMIKNEGMILQEYLLKNDDMKALNILHKYNCINLNEKDINGDSLLVKACKNKNPKAIIFLLDIGANVDDRASNGNTALMIACEQNNFEVVKILVERGANVNEKGRCNQTALMYACEFKSFEVAQYLIEHQANVNAKTKNGATALIYTFLTYIKNEKNNFKIAKLLLENGANINARGEYGTALVYAVKYWGKDVVKLLLQYGAKTSDMDSNGNDVYQISQIRGDKNIMEALTNININHHIEVAKRY